MTVGADSGSNESTHEEVIRLLSDGKTVENDIYIVRPGRAFVSDRDVNYLETHYPDLFPYGRGGYGEKRDNHISRKAYFAHLLRLGTRQFQSVDFVLPVYDVLTRNDVSMFTMLS